MVSLQILIDIFEGDSISTLVEHDTTTNWIDCRIMLNKCLLVGRIKFPPLSFQCLVLWFLEQFGLGLVQVLRLRDALPFLREVAASFRFYRRCQPYWFLCHRNNFKSCRPAVRSDSPWFDSVCCRFLASTFWPTLPAKHATAYGAFLARVSVLLLGRSLRGSSVPVLQTNWQSVSPVPCPEHTY